MNAKEIIEILKKNGREENRIGMSRYGINVEKAFGCSIPLLREIAKQNKKNHELALELWNSGFHEARILASMIDDPKKVDDTQMESWVKDFNSWDLCDQCCMNLFEDIPVTWSKAVEWAERQDEFVKRAGFVLMARFAVSDKKAGDEKFLPFLDLIEKHATDERNMVKKAVNWALCQIGKRNKTLHPVAIKYCEKILKQDSKSAKWIATDALKELKSEAVLKRLN
ncbi:MAG: DNA alkylation repair protein [Bacteroidota bacterium]